MRVLAPPAAREEESADTTEKCSRRFRDVGERQYGVVGGAGSFPCVECKNIAVRIIFDSKHGNQIEGAADG